jgi:phenylacetate-CoA ligase
MERWQMERFRRLLRHAWQSVPLYRALYRGQGIEVDAIRTLQDLRHIPVLQKRQLRELGKDLGDRSDLIFHKSSGSTGTPVQVFRTASEERRMNLFRWRAKLSNGLRPGYRLAQVKTVWEELPDSYERLARLSARTRFIERRLFDCLLNPADLLDELLDYQPHVLSGYPSALVKVAQRYDPSGRRFENLKWVSTGGEALAPHQRQVLERQFGLPVTDSYGSVECNLIAWQCADTGSYHVCDDNVLLEVCRNGVPVQPGEEGEVIVTPLHARTMPLIRYAIGDLAIAGDRQCACGQPFATLQSIQGRVMEYLVYPDGTHMHPLRLVNEIVLAGYDWIAEYQFVQETERRFRLDVVPLRDVRPGEEAAMRQALQDKMAGASELEINWVDDIPLGENGKYRFCRSLV